MSDELTEEPVNAPLPDEPDSAPGFDARAPLLLFLLYRDPQAHLGADKTA